MSTNPPRDTRARIKRADIRRILIAVALALLVWFACIQPAPANARQTSNHYSPAENLERLDIEALANAKRSIDIAMYAMTDRYLVDELIELTRRGVNVRIYRDREQFLSEQSRRNSTTDLMMGNPNIQIRVKQSKILAHLKAFCVDGKLPRDGGANWSAIGMKRQDNNARYTTDPAEVEGFEANFEELWSRAGNEVVQ